MESIGLTDGTDARRAAVRWFTEKITELDRQLDETEAQLHQKCMEIPHAENILSGILAEAWDASRFDDVKEVQKLSGMKSCSKQFRKT